MEKGHGGQIRLYYQSIASSPRDVKLESRYLQTIFDTRDRIDQTGRVG